MGGLLSDDLGKITKDPVIPKERAWNTNSNSLCNYMKDISFLKNKLRDKAVIPRYVEEPVDYLGITGLRKIAFPMICFCDIPFSKVKIHIASYGGYGIAFDKTKLLEKHGLQPIHYISENSPLKNDFKAAYQCCVDNDFEKIYEPLADYLLSTFVFMKPVSELRIVNEKPVRYIFQNECEWRYVPSQCMLPEDMDFILCNEDVTAKSKGYYSKVLEKHKRCWMKFDWDDIKYIIVPNENDSFEMIEYIRKMKIKKIEKDILISKIEVADRLLEDV